jgi:hypothetical protein
LADLPLTVGDQPTPIKKSQGATTLGDASKSPEDEMKQNLVDRIGRAMTAYAATCKRLIDLDDAIDVEGVEFDPNIDEVEWQAIRPLSLAPQKGGKHAKLATFTDCYSKNKKLYEIVHDQEFLLRVMKGRSFISSVSNLGKHGRVG